MDWETISINIGVIASLLVFILFWFALIFWLRTDAEKRGLWGRLWAYVGLLTGPLGLIAYISFWRNRHPVLPVVNERDRLLRSISRTRSLADSSTKISDR